MARIPAALAEEAKAEARQRTAELAVIGSIQQGLNPGLDTKSTVAGTLNPAPESR